MRLCLGKDSERWSLLSHSPSPGHRGGQPHTTRAKLGVWQDQIKGRFHPITVHQLAMAWWLYKDGPLTKRQLRIYFAAHEMKERRRYTKSEDGTRTVGEGGRRPLYTLDEVRSLIGSQDNDTALSADVKALGRLGLVKIMPHAIEFAVSVDQIAVDDITGFLGRSSTSSPTADAPCRCRVAPCGPWPPGSNRA